MPVLLAVQGGAGVDQSAWLQVASHRVGAQVLRIHRVRVPVLHLLHLLLALLPPVVGEAAVVGPDVSLVLQAGLARDLGQLHLPPDLLAGPGAGALRTLPGLFGAVRNRARAGAGAGLQAAASAQAGPEGFCIGLHHLQHPGHPGTPQQTLHVLQAAHVQLESLLLLERQSESLRSRVNITHHAARHLRLQPVLQVGDLQSFLYHSLSLQHSEGSDLRQFWLAAAYLLFLSVDL